MRIVIYHLNFVLGKVELSLPKYLYDSKSLITLTKNRAGITYRDNLCAFRCLAVHQVLFGKSYNEIASSIDRMKVKRIFAV